MDLGNGYILPPLHIQVDQVEDILSPSIIMESIY
jgi:hypothetical protein